MLSVIVHDVVVGSTEVVCCTHAYARLRPLDLTNTQAAMSQKLEGFDIREELGKIK